MACVNDKQKENIRFLFLKNSYADYAKMVDFIVEDLVKKIDNEQKEKHELKLEKILYYLKYFEDNLTDISNNYICDLPDIFITASCFMFSLIEYKRISFNINEETPIEITKINHKIAFEVALQIIWHEKVFNKDESKSFITDDKIENKGFCDKIINSLLLGDVYGLDSEVISYANLFELFFLYTIK